MELMLSKSKQLKKRLLKKTSIGVQKESSLQSFTDTYLKLKGLYYLRFSDSFWQYLNNHANKIKLYFLRLCAEAFGGYPDNMIFDNLNDKYLIALPLELKSKNGKLNGNKQKKLAKKLNYTIAKTEQEVINAISEFEEFKERVQGLL